MLLAERAGRKLERWSNPASRGMIVHAPPQGGVTQNPAYRSALLIIPEARDPRALSTVVPDRFALAFRAGRTVRRRH